MGDEELTTEYAEMRRKICENQMTRKAENNKSAFYSKINGFLFGSFKNYHYLCISERNNITTKSRKGTIQNESE